MSYMHIENLYKCQDILEFKRCYAMEKIHGTSANVAWTGDRVRFFCGGVSQSAFDGLFNVEALAAVFKERFGTNSVVVYGEAYGGNCQGMSRTYGTRLRFVAFEVREGDCWYSVPAAKAVVGALGLDFVPYRLVDTDICSLNAERDAPSEQSLKVGIDGPQMREGIVLRPPFEVVKNNGSRVIAKHKRTEFAERKSVPSVDEKQAAILTDAALIAEEWVTPMRLTHVLDAFPTAGMEATGDVIRAMVADVMREAEGEILDSKPIRRAVGARAAQLFKQHLSRGLAGADGASS